ncbi:MAG TPA: hypothetical protein VFY03_13560 [Woeseiaceae bacterium]|nr:hypothetical protein [Woeseiaceae bacterium]
MNPFLRGLPLAALALTACGGGGDSSGANSPPPSSSFAITAANAGSATAASWQSANGSASMAGLAGTSGIVTAKPGDAAKTAAGVPSSRSLGSLLTRIPFGPETFPCNVSGSITLSGDLANPTTLTAGDVINMDADACDDGYGEVLDGEMSMTVNGIAGDFLAGAYELTLALALEDFQVTTATDVETGNGDVTVTLDTLAAPYIEAAVGGSAMTWDRNAESATLSNYESFQTVDGGQELVPYTLSASGTLDSSELPGSVRYSTPVTFAGQDGGYPHTGEFLVEGNASSARLVALDDVDVRIDIDLDDDGTVDASIAMTWAELDAL